MVKRCEEAESIMAERFGRDTVIALATVEGGVPYVRYVDAYYEDGSFYVVTYALSNKMRHLAGGSSAAIAGDWFTAHGKGVNMGAFGSVDNRALAEKLESVFSAWIHNGDSDLTSTDTVILKIELTDGVLLSHGARYEL